MDKSFYMENRRALYARIPGDALILSFAGEALRRTADAFHGFFANRNFAYLTGAGLPNAQKFVFLAEKRGEKVREALFILPPDAHLERWNGRRVKADEARALTGIEEIAWVEDFPARFHKLAGSGAFEHLYLDIDRLKPGEPESDADRFAALAARAPGAAGFALGFGLESWMRAERPGSGGALAALCGGPAVVSVT